MNNGGNGRGEVTLTVVIPVYREHLRLVRSLEQVTAFVAGTRDVTVDVIFVDDGSPDRTPDVIRAWLTERNDPRLQLLSYGTNRGKGHAVKTGVLAAGGSLILMSDADLSTPLEDWRTLYQAVLSGADVACGSRAVRGSRIGQPPPLHRRLLSRVFNVLVWAAGSAASGIRSAGSSCSAPRLRVKSSAGCAPSGSPSTWR
jgi:dolichyl-phosphate beta-glucosyltransferase